MEESTISTEIVYQQLSFSAIVSPSKPITFNEVHFYKQSFVEITTGDY